MAGETPTKDRPKGHNPTFSAVLDDAPQLSVTLEARSGVDVRLEDFAGYLDELRGALNAVDRRIAFSRKPTTYYTIGGLQKASPATVLLDAHPRQADIDHRTHVLSTIVNTLSAIGDADLFLSAPLVDLDVLSEVKPLVDRLTQHGRLERVRIGYRERTVSLTRESPAKVASLLGSEQEEYGSVRGLLEFVNAHAEPPYFKVYPIAGPRIVRCYFKPEMLPEVREALKHNVEVSGRLKSFANAAHPHEAVAESIERFPDDSELPTLESLRGIAPDATRGESPEDFVRRLRDEWH